MLGGGLDVLVLTALLGALATSMIVACRSVAAPAHLRSDEALPSPLKVRAPLSSSPSRVAPEDETPREEPERGEKDCASGCCPFSLSSQLTSWEWILR